jgi:hypothetical protein
LAALFYFLNRQVRLMSEWSPIGKWLIALGLLLVGVGLLAIAAGKIPLIGRLPGDIHIERENFNFYFPLTTCLLLSSLLSLIFFIVSRFK